MNFFIQILPANANLFCASMVLFIFIYTILKIDWHRVYKANIFNIWLGTIFIVSLFWIMRASLESGLNIHLSGAMLFTLLFGWQLGTAGMFLVCFLVGLWMGELTFNIGFIILVYAYFSVTFSYTIFLFVEKFFPSNLYVYLFVTSFFGAAISYIITGTALILTIAFFDVYSSNSLLKEYIPFYCLMSFGEAFITCGIMTLVVVYKPDWVYTFRDKKYLFK